MPFALKCVFQDDVRRKLFSSAEDVTTTSIRDFVTESYSLSDYVAKYQDDEGDWCTLNHLTLPDALEFANDRKLLRLQINASAAAAMPVGESTQPQSAPGGAQATAAPHAEPHVEPCTAYDLPGRLAGVFVEKAPMLCGQGLGKGAALLGRGVAGVAEGLGIGWKGAWPFAKGFGKGASFFAKGFGKGLRKGFWEGQGKGVGQDGEGPLGEGSWGPADYQYFGKGEGTVWPTCSEVAAAGVQLGEAPVPGDNFANGGKPVCEPGMQDDDEDDDESAPEDADQSLPPQQGGRRGGRAGHDQCGGHGHGGFKWLLHSLRLMQAAGALQVEVAAALALQWLGILARRGRCLQRKLGRLPPGLLAKLVPATAAMAESLDGVQGMSGVVERLNMFCSAPETVPFGPLVVDTFQTLATAPFDVQQRAFVAYMRELLPVPEVQAFLGEPAGRWMRRMPWAQWSLVHHGVSCYGCGAEPIEGAVFRCATCGECDLCGTCFLHKGELHEPTHVFGTVLIPGMGGKGLKRHCGLHGKGDSAFVFKRHCAVKGAMKGAMKGTKGIKGMGDMTSSFSPFEKGFGKGAETFAMGPGEKGPSFDAKGFGKCGMLWAKGAGKEFGKGWAWEMEAPGKGCWWKGAAPFLGKGKGESAAWATCVADGSGMAESSTGADDRADRRAAADAEVDDTGAKLETLKAMGLGEVFGEELLLELLTAHGGDVQAVVDSCA